MKLRLKKRLPDLRLRLIALIMMPFLLMAGSKSLLAAESTSAEAQSGSGFYRAKGRDPFAPLVRDGRVLAPVQTTGDDKGLAVLPVLHGILWDNGYSIAMIDDSELQAGASVRGYQIVEIQKDAVILERNGKQVVLQLESEASGAATHIGQP